jgi:tetratricopeptide (TPR) repeat protein
MSLRFWQRIRIAPGVTLNLSKSTASLSFGPPGAKFTISPRGNRATVGLPGTGLFYTVHQPRGRAAPQGRAVPARDKLDLGFFRRLVTPEAERDFVDGMRQVTDGAMTEALPKLEAAAATHPDAAWFAGLIRAKAEDLDRARAHLERALAGLGDLGAMFGKYQVRAEISLPVADGVTAHISPCERGTLLALVEIAQEQGREGDVRKHLDRLLQIAPEDPVVLLSYAEAHLPDAGAEGVPPAVLDRIVTHSAGIQNDTGIDTALLLYRARALAAQGLTDAAIQTLTLAARRRKDRPERLIHQIRFDRAELYDRTGRRAQARREFEKLYADAPDFEGLKARLGL